MAFSVVFSHGMHGRAKPPGRRAHHSEFFKKSGVIIIAALLVLAFLGILSYFQHPEIIENAISKNSAIDAAAWDDACVEIKQRNCNIVGELADIKIADYYPAGKNRLGTAADACRLAVDSEATDYDCINYCCMPGYNKTVP